MADIFVSYAATSHFEGRTAVQFHNVIVDTKNVFPPDTSHAISSRYMFDKLQMYIYDCFSGRYAICIISWRRLEKDDLT